MHQTKYHNGFTLSPQLEYLLIFSFRRATLALWDMWQGVQAETSPEGAHGGLARLRETVPVQVVRV